jgi:hypothetical protein
MLARPGSPISWATSANSGAMAGISSLPVQTSINACFRMAFLADASIVIEPCRRCSW